MDNPQKNKLSMYLAVLGVMDTFKSVWQPFTGIADMATRLGDLTDSIKENSGIQGTPRDGIAKGKNRKQVAMINLTAEVAGDLHSFAVAQNNDDLAAKSDLQLSDLLNTPDTLVAPRCRAIYQLGIDNAAAIANFGTVAADMQALDEAIKAYEPVATAPREAAVMGKRVTGTIETDTKSADALLKLELDKAMRKFKRKNPDFAEAYANARIIVDLGGGQQPPPPTPPAPPQTPKP